MLGFDFWQTTILAFIQGLTEFLPISSSAHLILPSAVLGWPDQGLVFDVAVHLGTLLAVLLYFRQDVVRLLLSWCGSLPSLGRNESFDQDARLAWMLVLATLPVLLTGALFEDQIHHYLRNSPVIATTTIGFGLLLWWADHRSTGSVDIYGIGWRIALFIGLMQVLALVPGTSRSGITITAALLCQVDRVGASRFAFLLSIPVIAGAALLMLMELLDSANVAWGRLLYATLVSGVMALACIHYFLKFITTLGFLPFVIYRLLLGLTLFGLVLSGA